MSPVFCLRIVNPLYRCCPYLDVAICLQFANETPLSAPSGSCRQLRLLAEQWMWQEAGTGQPKQHPGGQPQSIAHTISRSFKVRGIGARDTVRNPYREEAM
jgi:hypothetical protein